MTKVIIIIKSCAKKRIKHKKERPVRQSLNVVDNKSNLT